MSLINQVLNQLEQRGAHTAPDQTQIRAVPAVPNRDWFKPLAIGAGVLLFAGALVGAWTYKQAHQAPMTQVEIAPVTAPVVATVESNDVMDQEPASRLSYELSVLPLPESLREQEPQVPAAPVEERPLVKAIEAEPLPVGKQAVPASPPVVTHREPLPMKKVSPMQQADAEYRKGVQAQQQGRIPEAIAAYESALRGNENHEAARLAMAALLQQNGQQAAAERILQAGLRMKPLHLSYAMALARMQLERDQLDLAVDTLQQHLDAAAENADFQAFCAALLQRQNRHADAIKHFQIALQISPRNGVWRMGYAISLQAEGRNEDAKLAYKQALATHTLTPELTAFVQQKLSGL